MRQAEKVSKKNWLEEWNPNATSSSRQQQKQNKKKAKNIHPHCMVNWWPGIKEVLREDPGRPYELFASVFTVEETEDVPCAHGETQQAETEIIIREFVV